MKVVINRAWGGFSISREAAEYMAEHGSERAKRELLLHPKNPPKKGWGDWGGYGYVEGMDGGYERTDPLLVEAVEVLGEKANGPHASLKVLEIPDDIDWYIHDYDGMESIHENHRSWY